MKAFLVDTSVRFVRSVVGGWIDAITAFGRLVLFAVVAVVFWHVVFYPAFGVLMLINFYAGHIVETMAGVPAEVVRGFLGLAFIAVFIVAFFAWAEAVRRFLSYTRRVIVQGIVDREKDLDAPVNEA